MSDSEVFTETIKITAGANGHTKVSIERTAPGKPTEQYIDTISDENLMHYLKFRRAYQLDAIKLMKLKAT